MFASVFSVEPPATGLPQNLITGSCLVVITVFFLMLKAFSLLVHRPKCSTKPRRRRRCWAVTFSVATRNHIRKRACTLGICSKGKATKAKVYKRRGGKRQPRRPTNEPPTVPVHSEYTNHSHSTHPTPSREATESGLSSILRSYWLPITMFFLIAYHWGFPVFATCLHKPTTRLTFDDVINQTCPRLDLDSPLVRHSLCPLFPMPRTSQSLDPNGLASPPPSPLSNSRPRALHGVELTVLANTQEAYHGVRNDMQVLKAMQATWTYIDFAFDVFSIGCYSLLLAVPVYTMFIDKSPLSRAKTRQLPKDGAGRAGVSGCSPTYSSTNISCIILPLLEAHLRQIEHQVQSFFPDPRHSGHHIQDTPSLGRLAKVRGQLQRLEAEADDLDLNALGEDRALDKCLTGLRRRRKALVQRCGELLHSLEQLRTSVECPVTPGNTCSTGRETEVHVTFISSEPHRLSLSQPPRSPF